MDRQCKMSPDYGLPLVTLVPYNYRYESLAVDRDLWLHHGDLAGVAQAEIESRHPGATALIAIGCGAAVAGSDFHFLRSWFSLGNWFCGRCRFWLNLGGPFRNDSIRHTFGYASRMFVSRFSLVVEVEKKT